MSPVYPYLCHSCHYEFDEIQGFDAEKTTDCPRCEEEGSARRLPSLPATSRGNFGTVPRNAKDKPANFNFAPEKKDE